MTDGEKAVCGNKTRSAPFYAGALLVVMIAVCSFLSFFSIASAQCLIEFYYGLNLVEPVTDL